MKTLASILLALTLALVLTIPALAGGEQDDMVTKTFKLTLHGDVPAERVFEVKYLTEEQARSGANPTAIQFCGSVQDPGAVRIISREACVGNGTIYTAELEFPRGTRLAYMYFTLLASDPVGTDETFFSSIKGPGEPGGPEDFETLDEDMVNFASYQSRTADGDGQAPEMPDTGAGAMAGTNLPIYAGMALFSLVAAVGYGVRRRW